jgi:hypothetical protein
LEENSRKQRHDADTAKPELRATQLAAMTPAPQVVARVVDLVGDRLACYIAGVRDARTLASWQTKGDVPHVSARRLQIALQTALVLGTRYQPDQISSWFTWLSDRLDEKSPASVLHNASTEEELSDLARALISAAKAHLAE